MSITLNETSYETTDEGFLVNLEDWSPEVALAIAASEGLELTDRHWDVINFLRREYIENNGSQPNNRILTKAMQAKWPDKKVKTSTLFDLFPGTPSKQAGKIAGLPESMRKGGY